MCPTPTKQLADHTRLIRQEGWLKGHGGDAMKPYVGPLTTALGHLQQATMWLMGNAIGKPDNAGAAATDYLQLFGLVALGYMWCRMVEAAQAKLAATSTSPLL